ncbi:MAG: methylmalonyl-CoA mutase family protein [Armatimonadota bacterium]|nr:methylmalonyl-CoA mutase family protein [Armatimonadota bacterium]MDR7448397.1 methylmalonyl-CoA mutase family protein [Armatimonadota bacterium]MDR7460124.1 methylmalonyl-CoA mutase family protein [Armatimonadota bacterium]MDR7480321.1 methylmalonyl-CoA mutase family protein [Armatimonadota bacterium]MDR7489394.1 methylmalonyl-CoA mutase family protein [Armatimonadota bacterium]
MADERERIRAARAAWEARVDRAALRRPAVETADGLPVDLLYTPADVATDYLRDLGFPGEPPYTRGIYPTMYRGRLWTMRQYAGYGTAEESNRRFRYLLSQGQTGLSVAFDLPTQMGYDSDHPLAEAEVGKVGVAIDSLADMEVLLEGIPLDQVSISMTINATAAILLAMVVAVAERRGVAPARLDGTVQNDILKEYIARGTYIFPPEPSLRLVTDTLAYCAEHLPRWNPISVSGYHIREAGATAVQEVAFTLADALTYLQAAVDRGLGVDAIAPRLSFFFAAQMNLLEEVAKFRAARRLWARLVEERFAPHDPRSRLLRFHTQTAGAALTAQQPDNNVVRVTIQALAAVLGGTQSLHTNARDEALALPSEESALVALRTQQILAFESGVADTVDPLGGAYYVEALTDAIEAASRRLIEEVERAGGMLRAIETGLVQRMIAESAYREAQRIERGEQVVVGVNRFTEGPSSPPAGRLLRVDPAVVERQRRRLQEVRARRDGGAVARALEAVRQAAEGRDNLLPPILEAVRAYATIGEICDTLRAVFGVHRPVALV